MPVKKTQNRAPARKPRKKMPSINSIDPMNTDIGIVRQSAPPPHPPKKDHMCHGHECSEWGKKLLLTLVGILLVYLVVYLGFLIRNEIQEYNYIGHADRMERVISINAEGSVEVKPDIAHIRMGLLTEADTVEEAQTENTQTMNALLASLKALDIAQEDIKTENYSIYPEYDWSSGDEVLDGYTVSQNVAVKIRDIDNAQKVIALAGKLEINDVGNLEYSIDDTDVYIGQAREDALEKINKKAHVLSQTLGVKMVSVVSYDEYKIGNDDMFSYGMASAFSDAGFGMGGEPTLEAGMNEVKLNVNVTFEIR